MKECIVIKPFTDKYDEEIKYIKGQRIFVDEERKKEMNFKKERVLEIIDVENATTNVETEEEAENAETNVETEEDKTVDTVQVEKTKSSRNKKKADINEG